MDTECSEPAGGPLKAKATWAFGMLSKRIRRSDPRKYAGSMASSREEEGDASTSPRRDEARSVREPCKKKLERGEGSGERGGGRGGV